MEVYFGGAFQGKLDYVLKKKGNLKVADGRDCDEKRLQSADVVNHLHLLIQRRIAAGESTDTLIDELYAVNPQMILICDEVGSGIVPLERKDRIYREAVGRVLCAAVVKSDRVERILCGIGQCLKQESAGITK